ncbi:MAG: ATP-dependent metallopeptidase FtsH/Yme1/Tma family protein, partial [Fervidobacterium pennivorans]
MNRNIGSVIFLILIALSLFWIYEGFISTRGTVEVNLSYSEFVKRLGTGETDIAEVIIKDDGNLSVKTKQGKAYSVYAPWF